jgi:hypothetical protein
VVRVDAGPKDFALKSGRSVTEFVFFISSGNDVAAQRQLLDKMIEEANNQFHIRRDNDHPFTLKVDRWEHDAARRTGEMNEEFVRRACEAHFVVVLLCNEVRSGTREEIEAVLQRRDVQLSVIWMEGPEDGRNTRQLKRFLSEHEKQIAYQRTGPPDSPDSVLAMVRVVTAALADITRGARQEALFNELR